MIFNPTVIIIVKYTVSTIIIANYFVGVGGFEELLPPVVLLDSDDCDDSESSELDDPLSKYMMSKTRPDRTYTISIYLSLLCFRG